LRSVNLVVTLILTSFSISGERVSDVTEALIRSFHVDAVVLASSVAIATLVNV